VLKSIVSSPGSRAERDRGPKLGQAHVLGNTNHVTIDYVLDMNRRAVYLMVKSVESRTSRDDDPA
jgi:hypothetical protein